MKQYRLQPGTSSRIYYLLTVKDDGTMMLYFRGTDRSLTEEASVNHDGWIVTKGAMYPPLNSGRWQQMSDVRNQTEEVRCGENEKQNCNMIQTERTAVCSPTLPETGNATRRGQEPGADDTLSHSCSSPRVSRKTEAMNSYEQTKCDVNRQLSWWVEGRTSIYGVMEELGIVPTKREELENVLHMMKMKLEELESTEGLTPAEIQQKHWAIFEETRHELGYA